MNDAQTQQVMTDRTRNPVSIGDKVVWRGRVYTIKGFHPGEGQGGRCAAIDFEEKLHTRGIPDECSIDVWVEPPPAKHPDVGIDDMSPEMWEAMTALERRVQRYHWRRQGHVSFCCHRCGFPVVFGGSRCDCCESKGQAKK